MRLAPVIVGAATGNPALTAAVAGGSSLASGQSIGKALTSAALAGGTTALTSGTGGSLVQRIASNAPQTAGVIADGLNSVTSLTSSLSNTQLLAAGAVAAGALSSTGSTGAALRPPPAVTPPERSAAQGLEETLQNTPTGSQATLLTGALGLGVKEETRGKRRLLGVTA